jgi:hypothetical protein
MRNSSWACGARTRAKSISNLRFESSFVRIQFGSIYGDKPSALILLDSILRFRVQGKGCPG